MSRAVIVIDRLPVAGANRIENVVVVILVTRET
jgi:hypothetical protein